MIHPVTHTYPCSYSSTHPLNTHLLPPIPAYPPPSLPTPTSIPQVRSLCSEQPLADIYAVFEDHVARLVAENQTLRQRNVALELKDDHVAWQQTPQVDRRQLANTSS